MESNHHMATFHELFVRVKPSCAENMAHGGLNQRLEIGTGRQQFLHDAE